jgi:hypothetical protein
LRVTRCILTLRVMETTREQKTVCTHSDRELLGWDRNLAFGRCRVCGQILLKQNGAVWAIRPAGDRAANDDDRRASAAR